MLARILIVLLMASLVACSYIPTPSFIQNRNKEYLEAKSIPPLRLPPGTHSTQIQNQFPIPPQDYPQASRAISEVPPGLYSQ